MPEPIGRERECAALAAFLDDLAGGTGGVVLIEGEGGTGKTTLAEWAVDRAAERGFAVLTGRSWELSQSVPYEPIVAALGRFLRAQPADDRSHLIRGLTSLSTLIDGLDLPTPAGDRGSSRARLHDAIATLVARIAADRPAVLLLDDLHWTDESSLEVLQFLCRDLPYVSVGIIATVRPADADERPAVRGLLGPLRRASFGRSISVRNLDRDETTSVIEARLDGGAPGRLLDLVWARSIGTPLVVHELIEDLLGRGVLEHTASGWVLHDPDPPIPRAAADLIRDRIDRASSEERELLDILAVADEPTRIEILAAVSSLEADEIGRRLGLMRDRRLVTDRIGDDGRVRWFPDHPIIGHVIAGELDLHARQRLHRRLAAADPAAPIARQARHIVAGGRPDDPVAAVTILTAAGDEALQNGAPGPAVENFRAALGLLDSIDADELDERAETDVRLAIGLGSALVRLQRFDEAIRHFERARSMAEAAGDRPQQMRATTALDRAFFMDGRSLEPVKAQLDELESAFEASGDADLRAEVALQRYLMDSRAGEPNASAYLGQTVEQLERLPLGPRASEVVEVLRRHASAMADTPPPSERTILELLECAGGLEHWELEHRVLLLALDIAGHLGLPELIDRVIVRARAVESRVGTLANWRIPFLRALDSAMSGGEPEYLGVLEESGAVLRSDALGGIISGLRDRCLHGPETAMAGFDEACRRIVDETDRVALLRRDLGRMLIGEGTDDEAELAAAALASWHRHGRIYSRPPFAEAGVFDYAAVLAEEISGDPREVDDELARLSASSPNRGLPAVTTLLIGARRAETAPLRADLLLRAADLLDGCRYHLPAAERRIEAAEVDRASVDDEALSLAMAFADSCGARWLLARAAAVERPLEIGRVATTSDTVLTKREWEVAHEVAKGLTNREVAAELFISIRTVTSHLDHIYTKLGFSSRDELTDYVADHTASR